ncbi:MAG: sulfatase-like hydrolase/transferase [Acidobacteria bacterium]|nr:sulfatase-like hydrolase/transferase [Acidobacteriota bacterium]
MTRRVLIGVAIAIGLMSAGCAGAAPGKPAPFTKPVSVLLISVDTLRADRVGGSLTPAINSIAARGASFAMARTTVPLTLPAHTSLMTGLLPPTHGVRLNSVHRFDQSRPTLARLFRDAGRDTAAVVGAFVLDRQFGLADGFTTYDDLIPRSPDAPLKLDAERPASVVADLALKWISAHTAARLDRPFFLWVHFYDPHAPYEPPADALARAGGNAYDGEVTNVDAHIGRLLSAICESGDEANTLIVVVGDHGESLGEHGERTHGMLLYDGALRIPLVMAGPGVPTGIVQQPVSLVDIAPTVLRLARTPVPAGMDGKDLFGGPGQTHEIYAETQYPEVAGWSPLAALVDERWKLIAAGGSSAELYDLALDGGERENVAASQSGRVAAVRARVTAIRSAATRSTSAAPGAEALQRLRALGYVSSGPADAAPSNNAPNPSARITSWVALEDALALLGTARSAQAVAVLARLVAREPGAPVFVSTYARALSESGRHLEALATYRRAVANWPNDSMMFHDLAVAAGQAGRSDEAIRAERAAIAVDARNAAAHNGLGLLLIERGQFAAARAAFEQASQIDAASVEYLTNLGNARRAQGDVGGAEAAYTSALVLQAAAPDALNGMGVLRTQAKRYEDAIRDFEHALQANPDFPEARLNLGIAHQQAGHIEAARDAYTRVLNGPHATDQQRRAAAALVAALRTGR